MLRYYLINDNQSHGTGEPGVRLCSFQPPRQTLGESAECNVRLDTTMEEPITSLPT